VLSGFLPSNDEIKQSDIKIKIKNKIIDIFKKTYNYSKIRENKQKKDKEIDDIYKIIEGLPEEKVGDIFILASPLINKKMSWENVYYIVKNCKKIIDGNGYNTEYLQSSIEEITPFINRDAKIFIEPESVVRLVEYFLKIPPNEHISIIELATKVFNTDWYFKKEEDDDDEYIDVRQAKNDKIYEKASSLVSIFLTIAEIDQDERDERVHSLIELLESYYQGKLDCQTIIKILKGRPWSLES
jgi:hypothetical protein